MIRLHNRLPQDINSIAKGQVGLILSADEDGRPLPCLTGNSLVKRMTQDVPTALRMETFCARVFILPSRETAIHQLIVVIDGPLMTFKQLVRDPLQAASQAGLNSVILLTGMRMGYLTPPQQTIGQGVDMILQGIDEAKIHLDIHLIMPNPEALREMRRRLHQNADTSATRAA